MSGVVDSNGQQWEHCNRCGRWVRIQNLRYEPKSKRYTFGRDLCQRCYRITQIKSVKLA